MFEPKRTNFLLTMPISDSDLELTRALRLPTFDIAGQTLLRRLTFIVNDARIEHVWYPVFPPDRHAAEVVSWLRTHQTHRTHEGS